MNGNHPDDLLADFVRTLVVCGFTIREAVRQGRHIEIACERDDLLGNAIPYLIALSDGNFSDDDKAAIREGAGANQRFAVLVGGADGLGQISHDTLFESLGGRVPNWRALQPEFARIITGLSQMQRPPGAGVGEIWQLFETATADALEILLGRRCRPLGGKRRAQRLGDVLSLTPDTQAMVVLVDAKASGAPWSASPAALRPMEEYVAAQRTRQAAQFPLGAALIVAHEFAQDDGELTEVAAEFVARTGLPITFLRVPVLLRMIDLISAGPTLRNAVRWRHIFARPGPTRADLLEAELARVRGEQMQRGAA